MSILSNLPQTVCSSRQRLKAWLCADADGVEQLRLKNTRFESRVDSAFFNQQVLSGLDDNQVHFTASVPFERFTALKAIGRATQALEEDGQPMVLF